MKFLQAVTLIVSAALIGTTAGHAQSLRDADAPAEFPPESYKSAQYVDSTGCVFVRAGVAGATRWIPRVTRSRKQICGMKPTPAGPVAFAQAPLVESAPAATFQAAPRIVMAPPPVASTPVRAYTARPERVGRPMATVASNISQPRRTAVAAAKPQKPAQAKRAPVSMTLSELCTQLSVIGRQYINISSGMPVRCGPQTQDPVNGVRYVTTMAPQVMPSVISTSSAPVPAIPKGYRAAWDDGRLNPSRGLGTAQGQAQMEQIWTNTVPRKLVVAKAARVEQVRQTRLTASTKTVTPRVQKVATAVKARAALPQQAGTLAHRYVQVGTFGVATNAQKTASRLQSFGLPVQLVSITKRGKPLQIVVAGPFGSPAQLAAGLNVARRAGFRDAFPRN
ncbi:SPOR domain-containing protein [Pseudogemmobacter sp. W21_MBD1_M6]|uniref:SPOR domain-containing protein n=1 Tax=Pseudogemmobacter sp. W21_MBD1_M6 TaxID=3240271 RepID=UPI003F9E7FFC